MARRTLLSAEARSRLLGIPTERAQMPAGEMRISAPFAWLSFLAAAIADVEGGRLDQAARQGQRELAVVGRLAGEGVPGAASGEVAHALRIAPRDAHGVLELHQRAWGIADHLAQQAPNGAVQRDTQLRPRPAERDARRESAAACRIPC